MVLLGQRSVRAILAVFLTILTITAKYVYGHGKMLSPRARNYNHQDGHGLAAGGDSEVAPTIHEYTHGICGNKKSELQHWNLPGDIQATYSEGGEIDITVLVTAHHMGYFEFDLCPTYDITEECFARYRLRRAGCSDNDGTENCYRRWKTLLPAELGSYALKSSGYEGEIVSESGTITDVYYKMRYVLPAGVHSSHAVLRWHYFSTNSCTDDKHSTEEFWNCADIKITARSGQTNQLPPPSDAVKSKLVNTLPQNLVGTPSARICPYHLNERNSGYPADYSPGLWCFYIGEGGDCQYNVPVPHSTTILAAPTSGGGGSYPPINNGGGGSVGPAEPESGCNMPTCIGCARTAYNVCLGATFNECLGWRQSSPPSDPYYWCGTGNSGELPTTTAVEAIPTTTYSPSSVETVYVTSTRFVATVSVYV